MPPSIRTVSRYLRAWWRDRADLAVRETTVVRAGTPVPATVYAPTGAAGLPTWIVLHGMTRTGRHHVQLVRFARSVAATGAAVVVPEVPEWRELCLAPRLTGPTVRAVLDALPGIPEASERAPGLVGFSFGAPQAIATSADPTVRDRLAGVVAFGGYCDLERTLRFQLTGIHEYGPKRYRLRPDPYGRWIVGANFLGAVPGHEDHLDAQDALRRLAHRAGDLGIPSWEPALDPVKEELRAGLRGSSRDAFDLLAPPAADGPEPDEAAELAAGLAVAGRRVEPAMDPTSRFAGVPGPVHLLHGRNDRLIPFTEAWRLRDRLPEGARGPVTITRLFAHSRSDAFPWREGPREATTFLRALSGLLSLVQRPATG